MLRWRNLPTYAKWYLVGLFFLSIVPIALSVYYINSSSLDAALAIKSAPVAPLLAPQEPVDYMAKLSHVDAIEETEEVEDEFYEHDYSPVPRNRAPPREEPKYSLEEIGGFIGTINGVVISWFALLHNRRRKSADVCKIED